MACRGCVNLQCNCFTENSASTISKGNGSQYAPFTFRPDYVPFPRPFGHIYGREPETLDGAPYTKFAAITDPDLNQGGNMNTGNRTRLTAPADGLYLVGCTAPIHTDSVDGRTDNISLRRNGVQVSTGTWVNLAGIQLMTVLMSTTTLLDLNTGDTVDMFVERVAGTGMVSVHFLGISSIGFHPHLWAVWLGGPI